MPARGDSCHCDRACWACIPGQPCSCGTVQGAQPAVRLLGDGQGSPPGFTYCADCGHAVTVGRECLYCWARSPEGIQARQEALGQGQHLAAAGPPAWADLFDPGTAERLLDARRDRWAEEMAGVRARYDP